MQHVLILGAGLSSSYLIKYLAEQANGQWFITIADADLANAQQKIMGYANAAALSLNVNDSFELEQHISENDVIVSLLPPNMHVQVAKVCIKFHKHLVTASYVSDDMRHLHTDALKAGVLLLNEMGLDPGIDHMSAMKLIHEIQHAGGKIESFKSYTGGLVAPEFDDNPWHYKFTWNPRNVILAGQSTASYIEHGELKYIPPSRIFTQLEHIQIGNTLYEGYANRDSLSYIKPYGIETAHTVLRGTLRSAGYCNNWNHLIKLGLTDDSFKLHNADQLTYRKWVSAFTPGNDLAQLEQRVCDFLGIERNSEAFEKLTWLGLFEDTKIKVREASPAQILQLLLQQMWKLKPGELDMIVMQHKLTYSINSESKKIASSLIVKGENEQLTAMAKTVGLPIAISVKMLLNKQVNLLGVQIPVMPELYEPVLNELEQYGVVFTESN